MARKRSGFWKEPKTQATLEAYVKGDMTLEQADAALGGTASEKFSAANVIEYYARPIRRRLGVERPRDLDIRSEVAKATAVTNVAVASPEGTRDNVITCRISDRDLEAVDALVEVGLRSTQSDAAAWLIQQGILANQPLFERIGATVQQIRRLRRDLADAVV